MHGGLICITFHHSDGPSVCLDLLQGICAPLYTSKVTLVQVKDQVSYAQPSGDDIGRCAHVNVKLLHYSQSFSYRLYFKTRNFATWKCCKFDSQSGGLTIDRSGCMKQNFMSTLTSLNLSMILCQNYFPGTGFSLRHPFKTWELDYVINLLKSAYMPWYYTRVYCKHVLFVHPAWEWIKWLMKTCAVKCGIENLLMYNDMNETACVL